MAGIDPMGPDITNPVTTPELVQIQSARRAMAALDAHITRTEARLRRLPALAPTVPLGGGGVGGTAQQVSNSRRSPIKMSANRLGIGPVNIGANGVGLNPAFLRGVGGKALTGALAFHVVAGLGNATMDMQDKSKELAKLGLNQAQRHAQMAADIGGGVVTAAMRLGGVVGFSKMLMRPAFGKEESERRVEETLERMFSTEATLKARARARERVARQVLSEIRKKHDDAAGFLESWTPDDFDVSGDAARDQLRREVRDKNMPIIRALENMRSQQAIDKVYSTGGD